LDKTVIWNEKEKMRIRLVILFCVLTLNCYADQPEEISELKKIFDKDKVDGSIVP